MRVNPFITALAGLLLAAPLLIPSVSLAQQTTTSGNSQQITTQTATTPPTQQSSGSFIPLTQLPGIQDAANSATLPAFLNQLYKICVGVGAVLAVIMIMVAGFEFMTSRGSVASNQKAKERIQNAILGLVLVLSPTIVFGIINPSILSLDFTSSLQKLQDVRKLDSVDTTTGQFKGADVALWESVNGDRLTDTSRCELSNGKVSYGCKKKDGSSERFVSYLSSCNDDENTFTICNATTLNPQTQQQCTADFTDPVAKPLVTNGTSKNVCSPNEGYVAVPNGCCTNAAGSGFLCCAKPKSGAIPVGYPGYNPNSEAGDILKEQTGTNYAWSVYFRPKDGGADAENKLVTQGPFTSSQECRANYDSTVFSLSLSGQVRSDFPLGPKCLCDQPAKNYAGCPVK